MNRDGKLALKVLSVFVLLTFVAGVAFEASAQRRKTRRTKRTTTAAPKPTPTPLYTVPVDTVIRVRINESLNSGNARVGDRFSSNVTEPVYANNGTEVMPIGSKIWGHVTQVNRAQKRSPGNITVAFDSCQTPNGRSYPINGSLASLQTDDVNADNEGMVKGTSNKKRDAVFIGGGTAGGAIIGGIAGGGKGALIGGILGGALGTGARVIEKEKEAEVKSGTEFGVILNRSVAMPAVHPAAQ